jgi:hypothetical protein
MSDSDAQALPDPSAEAHRDPSWHADINRDGTYRYRGADGDAAWLTDAVRQFAHSLRRATDATRVRTDAYAAADFAGAVHHACVQFLEYTGRSGAGPDRDLGLPPAAPVQGESDRAHGVPDQAGRDREVQGAMGQLRQPGVSDRGAVPAGSHPYDRLDPATAHTHAYPTDHDIGSYAVSWYHHDRTRGHDVRGTHHTHRGAFADFDLRDPGLDPDRRARVLADWWVRHPDAADAS